MNIEERLLQKKMSIEKELDRILSHEDSLLFQAMRYAVMSGGKRFRPLLALFSGDCFGVSQDVLLPFACALELIHCYSLVHDDLPSIDNDDYRRGKPSCHKAYGTDVALLAGDGLLTLAFEVLADAPVDERLLPNKTQVILEIGHLAGYKGMIGGQFMDISLSREELTKEIFHDLILKKTGALIVASVKTGAILGDAKASELEAIVTYGKNIGLAFQIRDDILDSANEEKKETSPRPNYVSVFGRKDSEHELRDLVETAKNALDENSFQSEGLQYLASKLLTLKERSENEENS